MYHVRYGIKYASKEILLAIIVQQSTLRKMNVRKSYRQQFIIMKNG